jgi:hypothetical protein
LKYIHHFCSAGKVFSVSFPSKYSFTAPQLAFKQAACVQEGTGFKVVIAAVHLHFDIGLFAIVEGNMDVKAEDFSHVYDKLSK